jgi:hypothetical protein
MRPLIYCPSIRQNFFNELAKRVKPAKCMKIDGRKSKCFSALLNGIISNCRTDIVVIANDKARPTFWDYQRLLDILQKGYGMVGLYRLGFFGLHKSVVERNGFFDERLSPLDLRTTITTLGSNWVRCKLHPGGDRVCGKYPHGVEP